jgi:hypothetical protein
LNQKLEDKDARIQKLEKQNADLLRRLERLERLLNEKLLPESDGLCLPRRMASEILAVR